MMRDVSIRQAKVSDRSNIERFLKRKPTSHRHLDWRDPTEWLEYTPYLLYLNPNHTIEALLNCVPEPKNIYWVRLFAFKDSQKKNLYWNSLFNECLKIIGNQSNNPIIASLAYYNWMINLLEMEGWTKIQQVIQFQWDFYKKFEIFAKYSPSHHIRIMRSDDLELIAGIDQNCFEPLWQQSRAAFKHAFQQASYATVFEKEGEVQGFQISTSDKKKAHLARIAVHPNHRRQQIGENLALDMIDHFITQGIIDISVNTQVSNHCSIGLYEKLYFYKTGDSFPIFTY